MSLRLHPETERLVEKELAEGHFQSIDEIVEEGLKTRLEASETDFDRRQRHKAALAWIIDFAMHRAIVIKGLSVKELIEEGRRM